MKINLSKSLKHTSCVVIPLLSDTKRPHLSKGLDVLVKLHLKNKTLENREGSSLITHSYSQQKPSGKSSITTVILFCCGKQKDLSAKKVRNLSANLTKLIKSQNQKNPSILMPRELIPYLQPFAEGLKLADYHPAIHKTGEAKESIQKSKIISTTIISPHWQKNHFNMVNEAVMVGQAVKDTRDFVNNPPNIVSTLTFVQEARDIAKRNGYKITVLNKKQIEKLKMGAFLAVNAGSKHPAHLVILEHRPKKTKEKPIVLVGKGLIFDTGGINLKPSGSIEDMQLDMAGGAVVLGVFRVLKKLNINRHVIGIVPVTDNSIGQDATKPSEIITAYNGKTIEIMNTDAEGRLILSDALSYAVEKFDPQYLIDFATLTGACMIALGHANAGLFGQDDKLMNTIKEAGDTTDEGITIMPISDTDKEAVKGQMADLTNAPISRFAGAGKAAAFLQHFVGKSKWAHLDIAGTAWTKEPKPYETNFATGYGIRLMVEFLRKIDKI